MVSGLAVLEAALQSAVEYCSIVRDLSRVPSHEHSDNLPYSHNKLRVAGPAFLQMYAEHFNLIDNITFRTWVTQLQPPNGKPHIQMPHSVLVAHFA